MRLFQFRISSTKQHDLETWKTQAAQIGKPAKIMRFGPTSGAAVQNPPGLSVENRLDGFDLFRKWKVDRPALAVFLDLNGPLGLTRHASFGRAAPEELPAVPILDEWLLTPATAAVKSHA